MTAIAPSRPLQARAQETCERLLAAGQVVLERGGLEAFNSNAVAAEAGVTPPSFYRYFKNKHVMLAELGRRLMTAQNAIIEERGAGTGSGEALTERELGRILAETLAVTRRFRGGRAVISALRAIPELAPVRLESHAHVAGLIARQIQGRGRVKGETYERARLAVELGYAAIEMLLEVPELDTRRVLAAAARALAGSLR
ncbi:TetR/AcrR family transcriptional regulator [Hyphomonas sp.]|uniref:TetR/AcrR family transcriptional regulator n=1 Tax=Hyphomonas sp. TaxID=87 RepID=UPI00391C9BDE